MKAKKVLILNNGSSGLKWSLLDAEHETILVEGQDGPVPAGQPSTAQLRDILAKIPKPDAVGHRIVHGGTLFQKTVRIAPGFKAKLGSLVGLDPLHMRPALATVDATAELLPETPQYASFDTAFHATLPEAAAGYALPWEWTRKWDLRRFGFHGLSVAYCMGRAADWMGGVPDRLIVCHLGSGCSVTAVEKGRSVDTTMGFTPLEGLVMGTRSGSIDPGLLLFLQVHYGIKPEEMEEALTHRSGLLGVSGISGDMRKVIAEAQKGSPRAKLAYDLFLQSVRRAVGSMLAVLGGADVLVFTGGIGENSPQVRRDLVSDLAFAGIQLDEDANRTAAFDQEISGKGSKALVLVLRAREDLTILREMREAAKSEGVHRLSEEVSHA